jgi:hypothetical protein
VKAWAAIRWPSGIRSSQALAAAFESGAGKR